MNSFSLDALERAAWTAIQTGGAVLLASPVFDNLGLGWQDALKIAAFSAAASFIKSVIAFNIGNSGTAQLGASTYVNTPKP